VCRSRSSSLAHQTCGSGTPIRPPTVAPHGWRFHPKSNQGDFPLASGFAAPGFR
jgi:hypothetical protein